MLRPSEKFEGTYRIQLGRDGTGSGTFQPTSGREGSAPSGRSSEIRVESKSAVREKGWTVEGRIPWSDFAATGGRAAPGEAWQVAVAGALSAVRFAGPASIARGSWKNTRLVGSPDGPANFITERAWPKLAAHSLITILPTPDGEWTWFIDQTGGWDGPMVLKRMRSRGDGADAETLIEMDDLAYSMAFHPRFADNGYVYLGSNGPRGASSKFTRLLRYTVRDGRPDPTTRTVVIEWSSNGHNGAGLAFANDGMLFMSSGDGTSGSDVDRVGQQPRSMRAKILRIDVDHPADGKAYSVPRDNPYVNDTRFVPETWAYGLRNPWRLTYDPVSGQLWSGENGQDQWEYARLVQRGANYGWSVYEGAHPFHQNQPLGPHPVTFPTLEFSHSEFRSLTGGIVYRGKKFPELAGAYVFGDFGTGRVWAAKHDGAHLEWNRELIDTPFSLTHVTADANAEIILLDYGSSVNQNFATPGGGIYRLERAPPPSGPPVPFPKRLSAAGIFADTAKLTPLPGVVRYEINAPGWHDGATSEHLIALPENAGIEVRPRQGWQPPNGTVLAQTLTVQAKRIETRVLIREANDWTGYTYLWNAAQTDADLADKTGADITVGTGQPWRVPSRAECLMCHSRQGGFALTLNEGQLNVGDQLERWERMGMVMTTGGAMDRQRGGGGNFGRSARGSSPSLPQRAPVASPLLPRDPESLGRYSGVGDKTATIESRARTYLAVNCAHCHVRDGGGNSAMEFVWNLPLDRMRAVGEKPQHGDFGMSDARIIAAGAPGRSVVIPRMGMRGPGQMPPVGTRAGDPEGLRLMAEWIASLKE